MDGWTSPGRPPAWTSACLGSQDAQTSSCTTPRPRDNFPRLCYEQVTSPLPTPHGAYSLQLPASPYRASLCCCSSCCSVAAPAICYQALVWSLGQLVISISVIRKALVTPRISCASTLFDCPQAHLAPASAPLDVASAPRRPFHLAASRRCPPPQGAHIHHPRTQPPYLHTISAPGLRHLHHLRPRHCAPCTPWLLPEPWPLIQSLPLFPRVDQSSAREL
jgi:hypothetical protein